MARTKGESTVKPKMNNRLTVMVDKDTKNEIERAAAKSGVSRSDFVRWCIGKGLKSDYR